MFDAPLFRAAQHVGQWEFGDETLDRCGRNLDGFQLLIGMSGFDDQSGADQGDWDHQGEGDD